MIASLAQKQFAQPEDSKPGGANAKRPAAGPTSRLLRVFLNHRTAHDRMTDDAWRAPAEAPAPQDAPGPILDAARLDELAYTMSPEELREFVWLSIVDTEMRLTDIASYRAAGNLEGMAEVARRIAREAASVGALHVHVLALRLENACRAGKHADTCSLLSELSAAWSQVGDSMCAWLAERASPRAV